MATFWLFSFGHFFDWFLTMKSTNISWIWWLTPVILELGRWRQEACMGSEASLDYRMKHHLIHPLKKRKRKKTNVLASSERQSSIHSKSYWTYTFIGFMFFFSPRKRNNIITKELHSLLNAHLPFPQTKPPICTIDFLAFPLTYHIGIRVLLKQSAVL